MAFHGRLVAKQAQLPSIAAPAREPGRPPSVCVGGRLRRRSRVVPCSSAPQQWRTVPANPYGISRQPGGADGGPPAPLWAAGWALTALVAFNLLRSIVLMWVRSQPRRPTNQSASAPRVPAYDNAAPAPSAVPTAAPGRGPSANSALTAASAAAAGAQTVDTTAAGAAGASHPDSLHLAAPESASLEGTSVSVTAVPASPPPMSDLTPSASSYTPPWAPGLEEAASAAAASAGGAAAVPGSEEERLTGQPGGVGGGGGGGSLQIANYQLRARGSKSSNNLGRVVICATLDPALEPGSEPGAAGSGTRASDAAPGLPPWGTIEWHQRFWEPLINKYADSPEDKVTGLLLLYGRSVLHILEGDNNQLFALLRELRPQDGGVHRLHQIRVPCYILDLRERLFDQWMCASAQRPMGRHRRPLTRAALMAPITTNLAAAAATAGSGELLLPSLPGVEGAMPGPKGAAAAPDAPQPPLDHQLVSRIQQLELFVKFVGPKLSALATQEVRSQALRNLHDYETTTPPEDVVASLAADPLAPTLHNFVESFDADYHRYASLLALASDLEAELEAAAAVGDGDGDGDDAAAAMAGRARVVARAASLAGDIRQLARFYDQHVKRDLKEALAERQEERRSRGADEVALRLSQGMRLRLSS